jgi:hypothetical protein
MAPTPKLLLILVTHPERQAAADMFEIARAVVKTAPDIAVHIAEPGSTDAHVADWKWQLPTLTVSLGGLRGFMPRRGPILQNRAIKKLDQHQRFIAAGLASPHAERFAFGRAYSEAQFGSHAVLKPLPLNLTSGVKNVLMWPTCRLHEIRAGSFAPGHFMRRAPALVQRFIDTGKRPGYFRVLTLLGEPLLWMKVMSAADQTDLSGDTADAIVDPRSTYGLEGLDFKQLLAFEAPDDVLDFARAVYASHPDIPLQACDIVREAATGRLFILEINAGGNTWDFSSKRVADSREKLGGRDRLVALYDPWPKAAQALIAKVRELAA